MVFVHLSIPCSSGWRGRFPFPTRVRFSVVQVVRMLKLQRLSLVRYSGTRRRLKPVISVRCNDCVSQADLWINRSGANIRRTMCPRTHSKRYHQHPRRIRTRTASSCRFFAILFDALLLSPVDFRIYLFGGLNTLKSMYVDRQQYVPLNTLE